jgi:hypothetical protein
MVWKDVLIGFTLAGVISAFVPTSFFETLFVGSGGENAANPGFGNVLLQTLVGPVAAFFTFIGSMGNIPLAALLFSNGVSFAGVMAFIFSDLVVFPVLRINASYYGWKMALYILAVLLACLVAASLTMHYALAGLGYLPDPETARVVSDQEFFKWDYTTYLNIAFLFATAGLGWLAWHAAKEGGGGGAHDHGGASLTDQILRVLAVAAAAWLLGGWFMAPAIS